jgi:hypothetical protein
MAREGARYPIVEEMLSTACTVVYLIEVVTYLLSLDTRLMNRELCMTVSCGIYSAWLPMKLAAKATWRVDARGRSLNHLAAVPLRATTYSLNAQHSP